MKNKKSPCSRKSDILTQEIVGEMMIYDLKINRAYLLNPTSSMIWKLCDGKISVEKIAEKVSEELDSSVPEDLVWLAIEQFKKDDLLEDNTIQNPHFTELSRREVIRKIGLSTMVALPMISSIVVPNAVQGQSCIRDFEICAAPTDCCSGCCADFSDGDSLCTPLQPNGSCIGTLP